MIRILYLLLRLSPTFRLIRETAESTVWANLRYEDQSMGLPSNEENTSSKKKQNKLNISRNKVSITDV